MRKLINENMDDFIRNIGPKKSLGIGTISSIKEWLFLFGITEDDYEILDDMSINLSRSLDGKFNAWANKPDYIKFNYIRGNLDISNNKNLENLEGCPKEISGSLYCQNSHIKSLIGAPEYIGGDFNCYNNELKNLDGFPMEIIGYVSIAKNPGKFTEDEIRKVSNIEGKVFTKVVANPSK